VRKRHTFLSPGSDIILPASNMHKIRQVKTVKRKQSLLYLLSVSVNLTVVFCQATSTILVLWTPDVILLECWVLTMHVSL